MTKLRITIGRRPHFLIVLAGSVALVTLPLIPAAINHFYLGGWFIIDLFSMFVAFMAVVAGLSRWSPRNKTVESPEEAAAWVLSREWERPK